MHCTLHTAHCTLHTQDSAATAKLTEGSLGARSAAGKYAAAVLHYMGKQGYGWAGSAGEIQI